VLVGTHAEETVRHDIAQHGVAEKFEAFVVMAPVALVREGLLEQAAIDETVPERSLEP